VPLSAAFRAVRGDGLDDRLFAATGGDDYELLFAAPPGAMTEDDAVTRIGSVLEGSGLHLRLAGDPVPLPASLGYQHGDGGHG
jgi:thiamine-monophosphate kinase